MIFFLVCAVKKQYRKERKVLRQEAQSLMIWQPGFADFALYSLASFAVKKKYRVDRNWKEPLALTVDLSD